MYPNSNIEWCTVTCVVTTCMPPHCAHNSKKETKRQLYLVVLMWLNECPFDLSPFIVHKWFMERGMTRTNSLLSLWWNEWMSREGQTSYHASWVTVINILPACSHSHKSKKMQPLFYFPFVFFFWSVRCLELLSYLVVGLHQGPRATKLLNQAVLSIASKFWNRALCTRMHWVWKLWESMYVVLS